MNTTDTIHDTTPLYRKLASLVQAIENCKKSGNDAWLENHSATLRELENDLPHGSGFDCGTQIDLDNCTPECLSLNTEFHHMEDGMYTHWTSHNIQVTPSLQFGFTLDISNPDGADCDFLDYAYDTFNEILNTPFNQF